MRYQKPIIINLNRQARSVSGAPESCISGMTALGAGIAACAAGTTPDYAVTCNDGGGDGSCGTGTTNSVNCFSGTSAIDGVCNSGATGAPDSTGCDTGGSY